MPIFKTLGDQQEKDFLDCIAGYTLYGLSYFGALGDFSFESNKGTEFGAFQLSATQCLIFSSLISAVDPVAVLAIFEEIHVSIKFTKSICQRLDGGFA